MTVFYLTVAGVIASGGVGASSVLAERWRFQMKSQRAAAVHSRGEMTCSSGSPPTGIPLAAVVDRRAIVIPVVVAGVLVQLLAVTVGAQLFVAGAVVTIPARSAMGRRQSNRFRKSLVRNYRQIVGNWILLRYLLHIPPQPSKPEDAAQVGTPLCGSLGPDGPATRNFVLLSSLCRASHRGPRLGRLRTPQAFWSQSNRCGYKLPAGVFSVVC